MHSSLFTYGITRPYPFAWFTPVVFIGGTIAIILFSFLNFVSNGYELRNVFSSDPNATVSEAIWFEHWPSFLSSKVKPICEALDIQTNRRFFTNQTGLTYTVTAIWQLNDSVPTILSSFTYYNNPLEECVVNSIDIDLDALDRTAAQMAWSNWGAILRAYVTCGISGPTGLVQFNLTAEYDRTPDTISFSTSGPMLFSLISLDQEARASLWWGESLLSMYWTYLCNTMNTVSLGVMDDGSAAIRRGTLSFAPSTATIRNIPPGVVGPYPTPTSDITDLDFFDVNYAFAIDEGQGLRNAIVPQGSEFPPTLSNLNLNQTYPNIWIQADSGAKSFYSTVLTDLGQVSSTSPNILTNATTLQYFTSNFSLILDDQSDLPGPALQDYDTLKSQTGSLGITPAIISTKYLCQVPRRKAASSLFVAVLLADLVFLQALWKIFTLVTETWLLNKKKRGPGVNYCEGCLKRERTEGHRLAEVTPTLDQDDAGFYAEGRGSRQSLIQKPSR